MRKGLIVITASSLLLSGCASQFIGTMTLGQISSVAGIVSTLATGRDLGEHALSLVMGQDCRFGEALVKEDRDICEDVGSARTRDDFEGLLVAGRDAEGRAVLGAPLYLRSSSVELDTGDFRLDQFVEIAAAQEVQYAEAEIRVAERNREVELALAGFLAPVPLRSDAVPATLAAAAVPLSGTVMVGRLDADEGAAIPAITPSRKPANPAADSIVVALVTPVRKPATEVDEASAPATSEETILTAEAPAAMAELPVVFAAAVAASPAPRAASLTPPVFNAPVSLEEAEAASSVSGLAKPVVVRLIAFGGTEQPPAAQ
ncbi:MAG: hypothetical protein HXY22_09715 [Alphaproteobacteria bacterium]|nr:hypothetical protein [Alphaproteobacteria bacterium]